MDFPRHVYKCGTATLVPGGGEGEYTAEARIVHSAEELEGLPGVWVSNPALAVEEPKPGNGPKHEAKPEKPKKAAK